MKGTVQAALFLYGFMGLNARFKGNISLQISVYTRSPIGTKIYLYPTQQIFKQYSLINKNVVVLTNIQFNPDSVTYLNKLLIFEGTLPLSDYAQYNKSQLAIQMSLYSYQKEQKIKLCQCECKSRELIVIQQYLQLKFLQNKGGFIFGSFHSIINKMFFKSNKFQVQQQLKKRNKQRLKRHFHLAHDDDSDMIVIDTIQDYFNYNTQWQSARMNSLHHYYLDQAQKSLSELKQKSKILCSKNDILVLQLPSFDYTRKRKSLFTDTVAISVCTIDQMYKTCQKSEKISLTHQFLKLCNLSFQVVSKGWKLYLLLVQKYMRQRIPDLQRKYRKYAIQQWGCTVVLQKQINQNYYQPKQNVFSQKLNSIRSNKKAIAISPNKLYNPILFPQLQKRPILIHHITQTNKILSQIQPKTKIFFLVHGLQATRQDMMGIRNSIMQKLPYGLFFLMCSNQNFTQHPIQQQAQRLAKQVKGRMAQLIYKPKQVNFIGHSLGGIVIRAAIPLLSQLHQSLNIYMSLSTPHLGYIYSQSLLTTLGMSLYTSFSKKASLSQLFMQDTQNPKQSYLYNLCKNQSLSKFKKIVLISSKQDNYVPSESANLLFPSNLESKENIKDQIHRQMLISCFKDAIVYQLHRVMVDFRIETSLDSIIGRAAHIRFISDNVFLRILIGILFDIF